jgi:hypothetical protein
MLGNGTERVIGNQDEGGGGFLSRWWRSIDTDRARTVKHLAILVQLGILVAVVKLYSLVNPAFYTKIIHITLIGFVVQFFLPLPLHLPFFLLLSLVGIVSVFGFTSGAWLIGLGLLLIGTCRLPLRFWIRVCLVVAIGLFLALCRAGFVTVPWSYSIWPILASMFMFRMIIYLYDSKHRKGEENLWSTLSYFFLLPNVVFPFFPVIDYNTFSRTHYDDDRYRIYQRGIEWMLRGITQLILYRFVYYYLTISPDQITDLGELLRFLITNFLLYLRISGMFHLIVGLLHLFGFHLPETNHLYYLASSFSDVWRRINIYWKDFMQKIFFYPAYFKLKKLGNETGLVLSTFLVFFATWFLHSYQWFWLRGTFLFALQDGLFWAILSILVVGNLLYESRYGRKRALGKQRFRWREIPSKIFRIGATFATMCVLWSFWTSGSLGEWLSIWEFTDVTASDTLKIAPFLLAVAIVAGGGPSRKNAGTGGRLGIQRTPPSFYRSAAKTGFYLLLIALVGTPTVSRHFGQRIRKVVWNLRVEKLSTRDQTLMVRGYYEELTNVNRFNTQLWEVYTKAPAKRQTLWDAGALRRTNDFLGIEPIPLKKIVHHKKPFSINSLGLRDQEYDREKPVNTYRIVLLGKSSSMGWGVADGENYESVMENRLNRERCNRGPYRYEVINFSVGGYNQLRQIYLLEKKAMSFHPDAVFLVGDDQDSELATYYLAMCVKKGIEFPYDFLQEIVDRAGVDEGMSQEAIKKRLNPFSEELISRAYREIAEECRSRGILPVFIFLPPVRANFDPDRSDPHCRLAEENGFKVIDLTGIYDAYDVSSLWVMESDQHPNAIAHRLIADRIFEKFCEVKKGVRP